MTVVAIDFETANSDPASPCAIGLAFIEGAEITRRLYTLVRPPELAFDPGNIRVHGIRSQDVVDAPEFPDVWREIAPDLSGALLVAHNASFDMRVLGATLGHYGLAIPPMRSFCTVSMSRRLWPEMASRKLSALAHHFDIAFTHHHAGEDAYACAAIALEGVREAGRNTVEDLAEEMGLMRPVAARPARSGTGIAARAMRARTVRASASEGTLRFLMRGSKGTAYDMSLRASSRSGPILQCSCPGSRFRPDCRHIRMVMTGDHADLMARNEEERQALSQLLSAAFRVQVAA